jgi:MFS family permease
VDAAASLNTVSDTRRLLLARGMRAFCDGYVAVLLPAYLQALGWGAVQIGVLGTLTLAGSALATLALGRFGHHWAPRQALLAASALMAATGVGFAGCRASGRSPWWRSSAP